MVSRLLMRFCVWRVKHLNHKYQLTAGIYLYKNRRERLRNGGMKEFQFRIWNIDGKDIWGKNFVFCTIRTFFETKNDPRSPYIQPCFLQQNTRFMDRQIKSQSTALMKYTYSFWVSAQRTNMNSRFVWRTINPFANVTQRGHEPTITCSHEQGNNLP